MPLITHLRLPLYSLHTSAKLDSPLHNFLHFASQQRSTSAPMSTTTATAPMTATTDSLNKATTGTPSHRDSTPLEVEITSDSVCPFCFIGVRRVLKAMEMAKKEGLPLDFSLRFSPFQLDPTLPLTPGENKLERYEKRFGGKEKVEHMIQAMKERGKGEGIDFSYGGNVSSTVDSHRMIEKARELKGEKGQLAFVERTFKTYFEEEGDPGSHDLLSRDAELSGIMSKAEALTFLQSNELLKVVQEGFKKAQSRGITGVPFTILNGKLAISGAQETQTFYDIFKRVAKGELKA